MAILCHFKIKASVKRHQNTYRDSAHSTTCRKEEGCCIWHCCIQVEVCGSIKTIITWASESPSHTTASFSQHECLTERKRGGGWRGGLIFIVLLFLFLLVLPRALASLCFSLLVCVEAGGKRWEPRLSWQPCRPLRETHKTSDRTWAHTPTNTHSPLPLAEG